MACGDNYMKSIVKIGDGRPDISLLLDQLRSCPVRRTEEAKKTRWYVNFMSIKERPCQMTVNN